MIDRIETLKLNEDIAQLYLRLKKEHHTEKRYLRFRNYLSEEMKSSYLYGLDDRTVISGDGFIVNVVRSLMYWHIIIFCKKDLRKDIRKGLRFFDDVTKHT